MTKQFTKADIVGLLFLIALAVCFAFRQVYSPDIGFHVAAGRWILAHHTVPTTDIFTYTVAQQQYVDVYWLYQIVSALTFAAAQEFGLVALNALLIATCIVLLAFRMQLRTQLHAIKFWQPVVALGVWAAAFSFETRPHTFSWVYLSLLILILERFRGGEKKYLWAIPALMVLWANTHTVFVLGWLVIGSYWLANVASTKRIDTVFTVYAGLSLAAPFLNPYFVEGVRQPFVQFQFLQSASPFKATVTEYASALDFASYWVNGRLVLFQPLFPFHLFLVLTTITILARFRSLALHQWLITLSFLYLAIAGIKNIGYFVFAVTPMVVEHLDGIARSLSVHDKVNKAVNRIERVVAWMSPPAILIAVVALVSNVYYVHFRTSDRFGYRFNPLYLPVESSAFLKDHRLAGRIVNDFNFGGYCILTLPQKVFIDGRNEVTGERFFNEYLELWNSENKDRILAQYKPGIVFFGNSFARSWIEYTQRDTLWRTIYVDHLATICVRAGYADSIPIVTESALLGTLSIIPNAEIDNVLRAEYPAWLARWSGAQFPERSLGLSAACYERSWYDAAIQYSLRAIQESNVPCPEAYYNLGNIYFARRDFRRAEYCYGRFLETNDDFFARERVKFLKANPRPPANP